MMKLLTKTEVRQVLELRQEQERIRKEEKALEKMDVMIRWEMAKIEREKSSVSATQYTLMIQDMERLQTEWQHRSEDLHFRKEMYAVQTMGDSAVSFVEDQTAQEQSKTSMVSKVFEFASGVIFGSWTLIFLFTFTAVGCVVMPIVWGISLLF